MAKYYQKHIYDVDIISTYLKFKKGLNNGSLEFSDGLSTKEFLARLQTSIEETTKNDQGSVKKLIEFVYNDCFFSSSVSCSFGGGGGWGGESLGQKMY